MATINFPAVQDTYLYGYNNIYIKADSQSVIKFCQETNITGYTYTKTDPTFSDDGGTLFKYYTGTKWVVEFGYEPIIKLLTY